LLNPSFGFGVISFAEMLEAYLPLRIDEVVRRPILVVKSVPNFVVAVHRYGISNPKFFHSFLHVGRLFFKIEFRRVHTDDDQAALCIFVGPGADVWQGPQAVDTRIGPEVHENDLAFEFLGGQRFGIEPLRCACKTVKRRSADDTGLFLRLRRVAGNYQPTGDGKSERGQTSDRVSSVDLHIRLNLPASNINGVRCNRLSDISVPVDAFEAQRVTELRNAQSKAEQLFREVEQRRLIRPGMTESQLNEEIYELAKEMFGITTYWHKRIVRAGRNTLAPYDENPPNLMIGDDDILFLDLGPVFEDWEADFGRTFVTGADPHKIKLRDDVAKAFAKGKRFFHENPDITSSEFFAHAVSLAHEYGWEFGGPIAGHLIGQFPHERIAGDKVTLYVHPDSHLAMQSLNEKGQKRHWILEIHFVDRERQIGGFFEELLTVD